MRGSYGKLVWKLFGTARCIFNEGCQPLLANLLMKNG